MTIHESPSKIATTPLHPVLNPIRQTMLIAITLIIPISIAVGLGECLLASAITLRRGHQVPIDWILASCGRAAVTHLLLWCPLFTLIIAPPVAITRRNQTSSPEPILSALAVLIIAAIAVPADLALAGFESTRYIVAGLAVAVFAAATTYIIIRRWQRHISPHRFHRMRNLTLLASLLAAAIPILYFIDSPLYDPATYRLSHPANESSPGIATAHDTTRSRFKLASASAATSKPNLLWIVLDTVRPDHMSCFGYDRETTPFLNEWSKGVTRFSRTFSNGMWTVPGHAAMFTGKSTREHGMDEGHYHLSDDHATVADILSAHGYNTASFSNNPWISRESNLAKGFQDATVVYNLRHPSRFSLEYLHEKWGQTPIVPWLDPDFGAALANHLAATWLDEQASSPAPFFMFVNYMEGHRPYWIPKAYRDQYMTPDQVRKSYAFKQLTFGDKVVHNGTRSASLHEGAVDTGNRVFLRAQYDATIRYLDDRIADLMEHMQRRGMLDNTLIIIASDHGEYLGAHDMWSHRFLTYNDLAHVALMIKTPHQSEGTTIDTPVQLSDLHTTILNFCIGATENTAGKDAIDLLDLAQNPLPDRFAITEFMGPNTRTRKIINREHNPEIEHRAQPQTAIQNSRYKYMISADGTRELYDLESDPGEFRNLIDTHPELAAPLVAHLKQWYDAMPTYTRSDTASEQMTEDTLKSLRSLGYLGGDGHEDN